MPVIAAMSVRKTKMMLSDESDNIIVQSWRVELYLFHFFKVMKLALPVDVEM